jgi:carbon monoxide dehydrogenase subunit G
MTQRVTQSITVRRPHEEVAAFATDPHQVLEVIPGFGRFQYVGEGPEPDQEEWDVFLQVGTLHVGGRVLVSHPSEHSLAWHSLRGTTHSFAMTVEPLGEHSLLTMSLAYTLPGLVTARLAELVARGITARHLEAGLEQVRHLLEHEDVSGG